MKKSAPKKKTDRRTQRPKFRPRPKAGPAKNAKAGTRTSAESQPGIRLNKYISEGGIVSRRKTDEMILEGRVTVNGKTVTELGMRILPGKDKVEVDGEPIKRTLKKIYLLLNKPKGVITSASDEKNRTTVIDIVRSHERVFPVGRLDYDTAGLLLLTNDGELANRLMHPSGEVKKTYRVKLSRPLEEKHRIKISEGVFIDGRRTSESAIKFPRRGDYENVIITIHEGRNRQVRKMFENYGYFVRDLERTEYAGLKATGLKKGDSRKLRPEEVKMLYKIAGLENHTSKN